jgi:hypothetical protein
MGASHDCNELRSVGVLETGSELERQRRDPAPLVIGAIVVLLGVAAAFYLIRQSQQRQETAPVLTAEAEAYLPFLDLIDVEMGAADTFLEQTLVEIIGKINNRGERGLASVEINCVFRDVNGIEIAREPRVIIGAKTGPLAPQQEKSFRLAFDNLPPEWNQALPSLFVTQIVFDDAAK